jgi:hypothetical protein
MYSITSSILTPLYECVDEVREARPTLFDDYEDNLDILDSFFSNPVYAGAIIMACCISPYTDPDEVQRTKVESFFKEIDVMDRTGYVSEISFDAVFGDYHKPLHLIDIPANPDMAKIIHTAIDTAITKTTARVQYPRYSTKPAASRDRSSLKRKFNDIILDDEVSLRPVNFERVKYHKRVTGSGCVQMKQRWYLNGIVPRTYFASGETAFWHGRFLQEFSNNLCDSLQATNRYLRVQPHRMFVHGSKHALFYDLTAFTSNLPLQYRFLCDLANYCRGIEIDTVDLVDGLTTCDLGVVIREYAETLNHFHGWYCEENGEEGVHGQAGYLGVYGNIATSTFVHGLVLLMLAEQEHEASVAGDDACIITDSDDSVFAAVRRLGALSVQKTYSTLSDAIFLKRRTFVNTRGSLSQHSYFQPPSFLPWMDLERYGRFSREMAMSGEDKRHVGCSSLIASFQTSLRVGSTYSTQIEGFLRRYYTMLHLPVPGYVPQLYPATGTRRSSFVPGIHFIGNPGFVEDTITSQYIDHAFVSLRGPRVFDTQSTRLVKGLFFKTCGNGGFAVKVLRLLGMVKEIRDSTNRVRVTGEEGLDALLYEYSRRKHVQDKKWQSFYVSSFVPRDFWPGLDLTTIDCVVLNGDDYSEDMDGEVLPLVRQVLS